MERILKRKMKKKRIPHLLNENSLHELDSQSGFSDTTGTQDNNFIVWHVYKFIE